MRLNSLEIKGFKSFGDKITIHFDKGVTAIVGPNGSGKSNVVDAMRWVLGEQKTRMLRSEKMENVIFNGTKTRNQSNLAEVTLSFENTKNILATDYSTVAITRKLYRDGTSEFYLNNVQCRLKDITDLFLDTGIGPDSYSIIELKMVDDILNDRNNTIKTLLEEAAGISKYKIRKKQTLNKLEETDADLNRVNDLMFEIEKSLKQLESQARKAEKYNRIKGEYKEFSIALSLFNIRAFRQSHELLRKREEEQTNERVRLSALIDTMEAGIQNKKTEVIEKEKSLSAAQKQLNEKLIQISTAENEKKITSDKVSQLNERRAKILQQNISDNELILQLGEEIILLTTQCEKGKSDLLEMQQLLEQLRSESENFKHLFEGGQKELSVLNNELFQARQDLNQQETRLAVNQTRFNSLNEELRRINEQNQLSQQKLNSTEDELNQLMPQQDVFEKEIVSLKQKRNELETEIKSAEENLKMLRLLLLEESRKADAKANEFQLTKNMLEQMEGYPESIRFLRTNHEKSKKAPLLSEIISCNDEFKVAIENYLEPFLNYFVVESTADAIDAIHVLGESAQGRSNFFVLENFRNLNEELPTTPADSIRALDAVDYDRVYEHLFRHLLGHVFIMQNDKQIAASNMDQDKRFVLLSSSGHLIRQRFQLAGGSIGLFDGKRTGKLKNLQNLESEIHTLNQAVEKLQSEIIFNEDILSKSNQDFKSVSQKLNHAEINISKASAAITSLNNNRSFLISGIESFRKNISNLENEISVLTNEQAYSGSSANSGMDQLHQHVLTLVDAQKKKQDMVNSLQLTASEASARFNQQNIEVIQQQNKINGLERDLNYKIGQENNIKSNFENNKVELNFIADSLSAMRSELEAMDELLISLLNEKQLFEKDLTNNETEYFKAKGDIDSEEKEINALRKQKENCDELIQTVHDDINELKLSLNSLKERLQLEFGVDINEIIESEPDEQTTEDELQQKVEKLKKQIQDFGPVNPMALEQFKEIKERHDFIEKEQEDLRNAKISLMQTISEIDQTAHEKFIEAFTKVRDNFIMVFRSLFTAEDRCDLLLDMPENPLESDITIIAQPKGKKPLTIQQLSGGEKTLTATALLFGIYLLKPAPFCIFDEVDAPLDDNNIDKFIQIIQKFSGETQFIIITHNKRTMTATEVIYGVTMAEQGVTQVVPVDMRQFEPVS